MLINGPNLGEAVSQTEYDVTAYRNVMDQIKTIRGELDVLWPQIKALLAMHSASTQQRSGFMMRVKGGKDNMKWGKVIGKELGIDSAKVHMLGMMDNRRKKYVYEKMAQFANRFTDFNVRVVAQSSQTGAQRGPARYSSVELVDPGVGRAVTDYLYDIHNLIRNLNWELNRLRIEMPFDLRQLTNQLNTYAQSIGANRDTGIVAWKIYNQVKELRKTILPKMEKRIREKIHEAELQKKVAADEIRAENEATLTTAERMEKENREAVARMEKKGVVARKSGDQFMLSFDDGGSWTKITRDKLLDISRLPKNLIRQKANEEPQQTQPQPSQQTQPQPSQQTQPQPSQPSGGGGMTEADVDLRDWAHEYRRRSYETQKANDEATEKAAKKEGDKTGSNQGITAAAAGLALLVALGQG